MNVVFAILGIALLMIVHEAGHHFVARAYGMRVLRFSIGFGPALWRYQPRGSDTVYQVALIPFLAYVQIDGMNPFEEIDPKDSGSYANASLPARTLTVMAGPLANYFFASVLFFGSFLLGGKAVPSMRVQVVEDGAAKAAQMTDGDKVVTIEGRRVENFEEMRQIVLASPGKKLDFGIERNGATLHIGVVPQPKGKNGGGLIGVSPIVDFVPMGIGEASVKSVELPAAVVRDLVIGLARIVTGREKADLAGPVGIVKETSRRAAAGAASLLFFLGLLSAYLGGFNLLPIPALDGGRLMFLGYEAIARRRANAQVEAGVHGLGLLMLLALIAGVTVFDIRGN